MIRRMERMLGQVRLVLRQGDITEANTEAIANAANAALRGGGGVDGAVHRAAGPELMRALDAVRGELPGGRLETGKAVITAGFSLRAKWVIHCVGPIYDQAGDAAPRLLASCYASALGLCREHGIRSIAFPSISTGVYGYPLEEAAIVALGAIRDDLAREPGPERVELVLFDAATYEAYRSAADGM